MATQVWLVNPGEGEYSAPGTGVTTAVGAAIAKGIAVTVDLSVTLLSGGTRQMTRDEALEGIEEIKSFIVRGPWPPA